MNKSCIVLIMSWLGCLLYFVSSSTNSTFSLSMLPLLVGHEVGLERLVVGKVHREVLPTPRPVSLLELKCLGVHMLHFPISVCATNSREQRIEEVVALNGVRGSQARDSEGPRRTAL